MVARVGIVGGGIMGCLAALAFAQRGKRAVIFERCPQLMSRASQGNEGKIHLGFTYGLDETGATRDVMLRYGQKFESALKQLIEIDSDRLFLHRRQHYAVHQQSMLGDDGIAAHMRALGNALDSSTGGATSVRRLSTDERYGLFSDIIRDAYEVSESSIDCDTLVPGIRAAVAANPDIEVQTGAHIERIDGDEHRPTVIGANGNSLGRFDLVINAAWEGMPKLEHLAGSPMPDYCLRAKVGFIASVPEGLPPMPVTVIYGSFGDVVPRSGETAYMSWYPSCLMGFTTDLDGAHEWYEKVVAEFDFDAAYASSCAAFSTLFPGFRPAKTPLRVVGGPILAVARTDIPDHNSRLHVRTHFGFHRRGKVIAIDTGKLTCGPQLALELMDYALG